MWIREFVLNHPLYKHDSRVNDQIQYDLMWTIQQISNGEETTNTKLYQFKYSKTSINEHLYIMNTSCLNACLGPPDRFLL